MPPSSAKSSKVLTPALVDAIVHKVLIRASASGADGAARRATLEGERCEIRRELARLVELAAQTGHSATVAAGIKAREARDEQIDRELAALEWRMAPADLARLEAVARQQAADCRDVLSRHTPQARQVLSRLCREKFVFSPEHRGGRRGYRVTAEGSIVPLLTAFVPELSQAMASPTGGLSAGRRIERMHVALRLTFPRR